MNLIGVCFFEQNYKLRKFFQKTILKQSPNLWKRFTFKIVEMNEDQSNFIQISKNRSIDDRN